MRPEQRDDLRYLDNFPWISIYKNKLPKVKIDHLLTAIKVLNVWTCELLLFAFDSIGRLVARLRTGPASTGS